MKTFTLNIFLILFSAALLYGETYYIDSKYGDDNNPGLSPNSAWQTIKKINNYNFHHSDTILFKCGSIWREELVIPSNSLTFHNYGDGTLPIILGSEPLLDWNNISGNLWMHETKEKAGWIWFIDKNKKIKWGKKYNSRMELQNEFDFYVDSNSVTIYSSKNPLKEYYQIEASLREFGIISGWYNKGKNNIRIDGIEICFTKNAAIRAVGSSEWKICNTILHHNGEQDESEGQGIQFEGRHSLFKSNKIFENGQHGIFISSFGNAKVDNNVIEANDIFNNYHTGIDLMNHGGDEDSHTNTIVRRNIIYDDLDFSGREIGIQLLGYNQGRIKNVTINHNLISNMNGIGISIMDNSDSIYIHNNTIINTMSACLNIDNDDGNIEVYNNVGINNQYYSVLFVHNKKNKVLDFNIWFSLNREKTKNAFVNNKYYEDLEEFRTETSFDKNGSFEYPGIILSNQNEIIIEHDSPCINRGINLKYEFDLNGNLIKDQYDIGAVEFFVE